MKNKNWIFIFICLSSLILNAQVQNGSFESGGSGSTQFWNAVCNSPVTVQPGSTGGGDFALRATSGNTQSCFPGIVYQPVSGLVHGRVYRISVQARLDSLFLPWGNVSVGLGALQNGVMIQPNKVDSTASLNWDNLTVTDTFWSNPTDTPIVILNAGLTGGPALGYAYFDLVEMEEVGGTNNVEEVLHQLEIFPNPVAEILNIELGGQRKPLDIRLMSVSGQQIDWLRFQGNPSIIKLDLTNLAAGIYILEFSDMERYKPKKVIKI